MERTLIRYKRGSNMNCHNKCYEEFKYIERATVDITITIHMLSQTMSISSNGIDIPVESVLVYNRKENI